MRLRLLFLVPFIIGTLYCSHAQTVVLDFETPATSTSFFYFESSLDGTVVGPVANPDKSGINTSDNVMAHVKPSGSQPWAGAFSNPNPTTPVDVIAGNQICMKVWLPAPGNVQLKLEDSPTGGANWEVAIPVPIGGEWVEVCWDPSVPSDVGPNPIAAGNIYNRVVVFFDFGTPGTDATYYFDDLVVMPAATSVCNTILDFEAPATSTSFFYFGSSLDGTVVGPVANPDKSGINTSDNVMEHVKPVGSQTFAGAFTDPNPTTPIDVTNGENICMKVWLPAPGNVMLKLEESSTGGGNWEVVKTVATGGEWVELCWDPFIPSDVGTNPPIAAGNIYNKVVVFFDFGTPGTGATYYFDDLCVQSVTGGPTTSEVTFSLNLNGYTGPGTQPTVNGTFNGFSGTANPLSDPDNDGIWTTTVTVPNGLIEYKFAFDDWAVQEEFVGTEACTGRDPSGQFVNRSAIIIDDQTIGPVCWNSCYNCGESVSITFNLGFSGTTPSPDGIWLAAGTDFGAPGGEFRMNDDDSDGIYSITVERGIGFNTFYSFANGNCPDYSCKENINGQDCAISSNFDDRQLSAVTQDTTINTCFGICSDNTACLVSIRDQLDRNLFSIAPSPTSDFTSIRLADAVESSSELLVMDLQGRILYRTTLERGATTHELAVKGWPAGVYMVQLRSGQRFGIQKLMVE